MYDIRGNWFFNNNWYIYYMYLIRLVYFCLYLLNICLMIMEDYGL